MAEKLTVGMQLCARFTDGVFYSARIVAISTSKKRSQAFVKVHYDGYGRQNDAWVTLAQLRSKVLKIKPNLTQSVVTCKRPRWRPVLEEEIAEVEVVDTVVEEEDITFVEEEKEEEISEVTDTVTVSLLSGEKVTISGLPLDANGSDLYKKLQAARPLKQDAMYLLLCGDIVLQMTCPVSPLMQYSAVVYPITKMKVHFGAEFPFNTMFPIYEAYVQLQEDDGTELLDLVGEGFEFDPADVVEIPGWLLSQKLINILSFCNKLREEFPQHEGCIDGSTEELDAAIELINKAHSAECFVDEQDGGASCCLVAKVAGHNIKATFVMDTTLSSCVPRIGFRRDPAGFVLRDEFTSVTQTREINCI